ncbi:MAG: UvrD-helicase domain-containing protein [Betaproteobacteria bacterium]
MHDAVLRDAAARAAALDPARSFIVQAPAGSGKTGLLIQRYLALLAGVAQPEAIVAMTFTRKAVAEIRERIIEALDSASGDKEPADAYEAVTWRLARRALQRDAELGWNLRAHPARLRVLTIDALATALMRQAPLATRQGAEPRLVEQAEWLHRRAAEEALHEAAADDAAWATMLARLDNDAARGVSLLAGMLGKREQWLRELLAIEGGHRPALERAIAAEVERELDALRRVFPRDEIVALLEHAAFAAENLAIAEPGHPLSLVVATNALPASTLDALPQWRALGNWLLTKGDPVFVTRPDVRRGFPPAKGALAAHRDTHKRGMQDLLARLAATPRLATALHVARLLPDAAYDDADWAFVAALLEILPLTAARLEVVFAAQRAIDFSQATMVALRALAHDDAPSDLLLSVDMRISHVLVDEFQDTSVTQGDLIRSLTAGWTAGDGRTLFLVGDPMQSIYGFRQADVALFVDAQRERRFGGIALEPLTLASNFRSRPPLVAWVNDVFAEVFPAADVDAPRVVTFTAAQATRVGTTDARAPVTMDVHHDAVGEAEDVIRNVQIALDDGMQQIAILARKRIDLTTLLPAMRSRGIAYTAVGLDRLLERPAMLDLLSLTHALLQPADTLAWLSLLRAPWCGLTLADLFAVKAAAPSAAALFERAPRDAGIVGVSGEGQARLQRLVDALTPAWAQRGRVAPAPWIRAAWLALGGPACVAEPIDLAAAERYFALLAEHSSGADVADWHGFIDALTETTVEPDENQSGSARVQVMTLHRAKGLEFDVVLMPALARSSRPADAQLLMWRRRPHGLLVAPLKARTPASSDEALYAYLTRLAAADEKAELVRLLYVGCTRARERLHLSAVLATAPSGPGDVRWRAPGRGTSLARLWPAIAGNVPPPGAPRATGSGRRTPHVRLSRLPMQWRLPPPPPAVAAPSPAGDTLAREPIVFDWVREHARQAGIAAHDVLRRIASEGLDRWDAQRAADERGRIERDWLALGFDAAEARTAADLVIQGTIATLADARGRWLFDSAHAHAESELALSAALDGATLHVVLDRTFVDAKGTRWIVDFKLSRHEGGDLDAFLERENERYRTQLERYARAMRGIDARPIRLGLYFPLHKGWREWAFDG